MQFTTTPRVCAFCGTRGDRDTEYAGGFGVLMCADCVRFFAEAMARDQVVLDKDGCSVPLRRRPMDDLSNQELLDTLPRITDTAGQVSWFMGHWVEQTRSRKLSWTKIGDAMGISRQAAWERFTRVTHHDTTPLPPQ